MINRHYNDYELPKCFKKQLDDDWDQQVKDIKKRHNNLRKKYGFKTCPHCGVEYDKKTVSCVHCEYRIDITSKSLRK